MNMMDARQGFWFVLFKAIKTTFWYVGTSLFVWCLGRYSWWAGVVLYAILALMIAVNIWLYIVSTISFLLPRQKSFIEQVEDLTAPPSDNVYLVAASIIRLLKEVICVLCLVYLYRFFF